MGSINSQKEACRKVRGSLDAHLSGELGSEAARETAAHLKGCGPCAELFEESLRVRDLVRRAVRGVAAPGRLKGAVRAMMRKS